MPAARAGAARAALAQAMALRGVQDMAGALAAIADAARIAPDDAAIAAANAHIHYEAWQPATALFQRALALDPASLPTLRGLAHAVAAQGDGAGAQALLADALARHPDWVDGH
ncbi:MAG: tetratricopeptide repeat protein, partial [Sphingopyxis sp.]